MFRRATRRWRHSSSRHARSVRLLTLGSFLLLGRTARAADPVPPANEPSTPAGATGAVEHGAAGPVEEVKIGGRPRETSSANEHRIGHRDIRLVPGAFGDPYRAIEILPGVAPITSGLPYYFVRGAPPSAVGYFIDDVRVPYLFHFGLGPGVIQPALVEEVSLHPAAYPARYGRYAGGVVVGQTREPGSELRAQGQVRLFDAGAYVEVPFAGGRGAAGAGGRFAYTAALFSLFSPDTTLEYRDYNARISYELDDRWRATAFTFGSYDFASQRNERGRDEVLFASEFHRLDLRLDRRGGDGSTSRIAATLGLDRTRLDGRRFAEDLLVGLRARHRVRLERSVDVEVGVDTTVDRYRADRPSPYALRIGQSTESLEAFFAPRVETATGAWVSLVWHPQKRFEIIASARSDLFTSAGVTELGPSPRASVRVPLTRGLSFLGAVAVAPQAPALSIPVPAVGYRGLPGGLAYAYQKSAGADAELPARFLLRVVGFHHTYHGLRSTVRTGEDLYAALPQPRPESPTEAFGAEIFLNRRFGDRFGAFTSVTLSRTEIGSAQYVPRRVSPFDRTHVLQVGGAIDLGRGWGASARFLTYGGWPREASLHGSSVRVIERLPAFARLDARLEKRWSWRRTGHLALVLEVLNATASEEIVGRECPFDEPCRDTKFGPVVIPSLGLEGAL